MSFGVPWTQASSASRAFRRLCAWVGARAPSSSESRSKRRAKTTDPSTGLGDSPGRGPYPDAARPHFEAVATDDFSVVPQDNVWVLAMLWATEACAQLNDAPRAAVLYRLLRPYADQFAFTTGSFQGGIAYHLGVLATVTGHFQEAEVHFAAAEAMHQRIGAPTWLARTRLEWARMLLARRQPGDAERARDLLDRAVAAARELGLGNVERRAVQLLT